MANSFRGVMDEPCPKPSQRKRPDKPTPFPVPKAVATRPRKSSAEVGQVWVIVGWLIDGASVGSSTLDADGGLAGATANPDCAHFWSLKVGSPLAPMQRWMFASCAFAIEKATSSISRRQAGFTCKQCRRNSGLSWSRRSDVVLHMFTAAARLNPVMTAPIEGTNNNARFTFGHRVH